MSPAAAARVRVRNTRPEDFAEIVRISRVVYPDDRWYDAQLARHCELFPEGQLVAVGADTGRVLGMAASLLVSWEEHEPEDSWHDLTSFGLFNNHDPSGRTLYGAEIMVDPEARRRGVGSALYEARRDLARSLGLERILAHSRLAGYHREADRLTAREYVRAVNGGELSDPPLSFQMSWGFRVLAVVPNYLPDDTSSLGWAALIEWRNDPM